MKLFFLVVDIFVNTYANRHLNHKVLPANINFILQPEDKQEHCKETSVFFFSDKREVLIFLKENKNIYIKTKDFSRPHFLIISMI